MAEGAVVAEGGTNSAPLEPPVMAEAAPLEPPAGDDSIITTNATPLLETKFLETREGRKLSYHKLAGTSPGVVFIHGLNSDMEGKKAQALEQVCKRRGTAYVRFDLSGHGNSSLNFSACNITMWLEDLNSVLSSLTTGPQVLVGSSMGAWLMFLYTMRNPDNIFGLIGIGAAPDFTQEQWKNLSHEEKQMVKKTGVYKLETPYSSDSYELTLQLIQDGDKYSIMEMPGEKWGEGRRRIEEGRVWESGR